jgi:hypothetical protein
MSALKRLHLGSARAVTSLQPLRPLAVLDELVLDATTRVCDYSDLQYLAALRRLEVAELQWPPPTHADSVNFLHNMTQLRSLVWSPRVRDLDYSPFWD